MSRDNDQPGIELCLGLCHEEYLVGTDWSWPACHEIDQLHFEERGGDAIRISKRKVHCGMYET